MADAMERKGNKGGRPSLLDEAVTRLLETVFIGGTTIADACAYAGISEAVFYRWMKIGRALDAGHKRDDDHPYIPYKKADRERFLEFFKSIKRARAVMRVEAISLIRLAANDGNWQAAAWLLERSDPENWGRKVITQQANVDITSDGQSLNSITGMADLFRLIGQREKEVLDNHDDDDESGDAPGDGD